MAWKTVRQHAIEHDLILSNDPKQIIKYFTQDDDTPRCPNCGSDWLTNGMDEDDNITVVCRSCGYEWLPEVE